MKIKSILIAALTVSLLCGSVLAQEQTPPPKTPRITKKQTNQQARIKQGIKSGELTKGEVRKLKKEQAKIQHDKKVAKSDGKVTPKEREKIRIEQKKASRHINKMKHNDKTRK